MGDGCYCHKVSDKRMGAVTNPNSLGPRVMIGEIFGLVKSTAATSVIVPAPHLHLAFSLLASLPSMHVQGTHNSFQSMF
jgi:hypothetical protein